ncbi:MAG: VPLPA-CTERM sorting domain-containing protein [Methylococcales bacterium]
MNYKKNVITALLVSASVAGFSGQAFAHQTYNLTGVNVGAAASVNNTDGVSNTGGYGAVGVGGRVAGAANANIPGTGGLPTEYTGALPYNWYSGQHSTAAGVTTRHHYTGTSATDSPSLWRALNNQNNSATWGALVPDLNGDHPYLAVGGQSWSIGSTAGGLDYGLIHVSCGADTAAANCASDGAIKLDLTVKLDANYSALNGTGLLDVALYRGADQGHFASRTNYFDPNDKGVQGSTLNAGGDLTKLWQASMTSSSDVLSFTQIFDLTEFARTDSVNGSLEDGIAGFYTLIIGAHNGGQAVAYDVVAKTSVVPVPAAVWLFGSAIAGFAGFGRRSLKAA